MRAHFLVVGLLMPFCFAASSTANAQLLEPTFDKASRYWIEDTEKNCWAANPNPAEGESISWSGPACDGALISGEGALVWNLDGRVIGRDTGTFRNGMLWGPGKLEFESGAMFEGVFPGLGTVTLPDGGQFPARTIQENAGWFIEEITP